MPARPIIYLGMDVHKDSMTIALLPEGAKAPTRLEKLPNDLPKLKKWIARVARGGEIRACYEASGAGSVLHRAMREWGYACDVIAPSLIPKRSGVQRKHDKRDAADLARYYRAGELTAVRIPSEAEERVRDIVRCRETFQREILKSRLYILQFLARRGFAYREGTAIGDWRRFEYPLRLGAITKAGNTHCRHVLVQAAWSYRHRPQTSVDLKRRQQGQPPAVITHAMKRSTGCMHGSTISRIGSGRRSRWWPSRASSWDSCGP